MNFRLLGLFCFYLAAIVLPVSSVLADPALNWITRLGGETPTETTRGVAVAASGNIYVVGSSNESFGSPLNAHGGAGKNDILLAKYNSAGQLQWHTFFGGQESEFGEGIVLDEDENIYVAGKGFENFGTPVNDHAGARVTDPLNSDILIAKFDLNGALLWHTFHGIGQENILGGENDQGIAVDVDQMGNVYVTGDSDGLWGSPISGFPNNNVRQTVVLKLNSSGELLWHTFHGPAEGGGSGGWSIALDDTGDVFVAGIARASWGNPRSDFVTASAQLFKLSTNGALLWNTFAAGQGSAYSVALDETGNIYISGAANNAWAGDSINPYSGDNDIAIARFRETGHLDWQTFHGTDGDEVGATIMVGPNRLFVLGAGQNTWGVPLDVKASPDGTFCGLALELAHSGNLINHSFQCGEAGTNAGVVFNWSTLSRTISGGLYPGGQPLMSGVSDTGWGTPIDDITGTGIFLAQLGFPTPAEIAVEGGGQDITDGDLNPGLDDETDFGVVAEMNTVAKREFTIRNLGIGNLDLTGAPLVTVSGDHAADFTISQDPNTPVAPDADTQFEVTFDPGALGLRSATISIANNDEDENPFTFGVQGTGEPNVVEMSVRAYDIEIVDGSQNYSSEEGTHFGTTVYGATINQEFIISNSGNSDLNLSGSPKVEISGVAADDFSVSIQPSSPVAAGTETQFTVSFTPGESGGEVRTAQVSIVNNDADENPYNFGVRGEAAMGNTVGGTINGLIGTGLVLRNSTLEDKLFNSGGPFTFDVQLWNFQSYDVSVLTQPTGPDQNCSVENGQGMVIGANVDNVIVNCDAKYSVGGTVTGLVGSGIELLNNCGDDLGVGDNGDFQFPMFLDNGAPYSVTIKTQPSESGLVCGVSNGEGIISGASVTNVQITCGGQDAVFEDGFEAVTQQTCP
jgi:hypothetical protein